MKKIVFGLIIAMVIPLAFVMGGCSFFNTSNKNNPESQAEFVEVGNFQVRSQHCYVYANKSTGVMYLIDSTGSATLMVNVNGSPMVYQGE